MAEGKGYGEFRTGWPVVVAAMLGIGLGLSPVPFYTIGMLAPELAREFGWTFGDIMGGLPIMTFAVLVASPAVGFLADRIGVRPVALASVGLFALSFMAFALNPGDIRFFYANWAIMAVLGAGTLPITWTRAVNNRFDDRKGLALGLSLLGTGVFGFLVKPFTALMIAEFGWRGAYLAVGASPCRWRGSPSTMWAIARRMRRSGASPRPWPQPTRPASPFPRRCASGASGCWRSPSCRSASPSAGRSRTWRTF
jgi:MFS family permease